MRLKADDILQLIDKHQPVPASKLRSITALSTQCVEYHLRNLIATGKIHIAGTQGRSRLYAPVSRTAVPPVEPPPKTPIINLNASIDRIASDVASLILDRVKALLERRLAETVAAVKLPPTPELKFEDALDEALGKALAPDGIVQETLDYGAACAPVRAVKPRILIVGPLPAQQQALLSEFGEQLDLRFWDSGRGSTAQLTAQAASANHIVVMVHKTSHKITDPIRKFNPHLVPGGVSAIKAKLVELGGGVNGA